MKAREHDLKYIETVKIPKTGYHVEKYRESFVDNEYSLVVRDPNGLEQSRRTGLSDGDADQLLSAVQENPDETLSTLLEER